MGWPSFFARAIVFWFSPSVLEELCPQAVLKSSVAPPQKTVIITKTMTRTIPLLVTSEQVETDRPTSGLLMHPLTFFLILLTILSISSFLSFVLVGANAHRSRSGRLARDQEVTANNMTRLRTSVAAKVNRIKCGKAEVVISCKRQVESSRRQLAAMEGQVKALQEQNELLRRTLPELANLRRQCKDLSESENSLQKSVNESNLIEDQLRTRIASLEAASDRLKQETQNLENNKFEAQIQASTHKNTCDAVHNEIVILEARSMVSELKMNRLEAQESAAVKEAEAHKETCAKLRGDITTLEAKSKQLNQDKKHLQDKEQAALKEIEAHKGSCAQMRDETSKLASEKDDLVNRQTAAQTEWKKKLGKADAEKNILKSEIRQLRQQIESLNFMLTSSTKDRSTAQEEKRCIHQALIQSGREKRLVEEALEKSLATEQKLQSQLSTSEDKARDLSAMIHSSECHMMELESQLTVTEGQLLEKCSELEQIKGGLDATRDQTSMNERDYDELAIQYGIQEQKSQALRMKLDEAEAVVKHIANDLEIGTAHSEIVASSKTKVMTCKAIYTRGRLVRRTFEEGASSFRSVNGINGRGHSVAAAETRLQVARNLQGRAIHLLKAEEKEYFLCNKKANASKAEMGLGSDIQKAMTALRNGNRPYSDAVIQSMATSLNNSLAGIDLATSGRSREETSKAAFADESQDTSTWWSRKTQYDISSLLSYRLRNVEKQATGRSIVPKSTKEKGGGVTTRQ